MVAINARCLTISLIASTCAYLAFDGFDAFLDAAMPQERPASRTAFWFVIASWQMGFGAYLREILNPDIASPQRG